MEISARNQFKGTVKSVTTGTVMAEVVVDAGGQEIVAAITRGGVESLGIAEGQEVTVVIKATEGHARALIGLSGRVDLCERRRDHSRTERGDRVTGQRPATVESGRERPWGRSLARSAPFGRRRRRPATDRQRVGSGAGPLLRHGRRIGLRLDLGLRSPRRAQGAAIAAISPRVVRGRTPGCRPRRRGSSSRAHP